MDARDLSAERPMVAVAGSAATDAMAVRATGTLRVSVVCDVVASVAELGRFEDQRRLRRRYPGARPHHPLTSSEPLGARVLGAG